MSDIASRLRMIQSQLSPSVRLLAVSKTFGPSAVEAAWHADQRAFGENYVQEAVDKIKALMHLKPSIEWHLIGPLQSNKTAVAAEYFDWIQTIDRFKIAQRLNDQRPAHLPPLNICLQINVDGGANKSGLNTADGSEALLVLARQIAGLPRLMLRGLLAIPEPQADRAAGQAVFAQAKTVFDALNAQLLPACQMDTLSMGMSADFESAVRAGSSMVRIGSSIFGERTKGMPP